LGLSVASVRFPAFDFADCLCCGKIVMKGVLSNRPFPPTDPLTVSLRRNSGCWLVFFDESLATTNIHSICGLFPSRDWRRDCQYDRRQSIPQGIG
jgi:hypothetical protein